jgi:hypothetical protein
MKTKMNFSNLKKLTLTACAVLIITTAGFTQPKAPDYENSDLTFQVRLEAFMNLSQQSIRYKVPATIETEDVSVEMERLDILVNKTEALLKYEAPAADETTTSTSVMERLDMLAAATEASLKYKAPVTDEISYDENITEKATEIMLADQIK